MNKKLLAVAVAGALAAPGVALAQSTVTITGTFKVSMDQVNISGGSSDATGVRIGNTGASLVNTALSGPAGRTNTSERRVSDNSSKIIFAVREDLGNGLAAIAQLDQRFDPPTLNGALGAAGAGFAATGGGNTWVGLDSKSWGRLTMGSHDLHYGKGGDSINSAGAGSLQMWSSSIFDSIGKPAPAAAAAAAGGVVAATATGAHSSLASQSRTRGVVRWDSPNFNGAEVLIAWSAHPLCPGSGGGCTGGDLGQNVAPGSTLAWNAGNAGGTNGLAGTGPNAGQMITRKGDGWNINPKYNAANWGVEYSYWNAKGDLNNQSNVNLLTPVTLTTVGTTTAPAVVNTTGYSAQDDQRSDVIAGYYTTSGFRIGLAWNHSKTTAPASGLVTGDRTSWVFPVSYNTGPHTFAMAYTKANDSKDITRNTGTAWGQTSGQYPITAATTGYSYTVSGAGTGASMFTMGYQYDLSKRTALGLSYGRLANRAAANYGFFYNAQTVFGSANAGASPGETHSLAAATIRHNF